MPTERGNLWSCDRCGLDGFGTFEDCRSHELQCAGDPRSIRKRRRPGSSSPYGDSGDDTTPLQLLQTRQGISPRDSEIHRAQPASPTAAHKQHYTIAKSEGPTSPSHPVWQELHPTILLTSEDIERAGPSAPSRNLSELDSLTCQHVEAFQATAEDVADSDGRSASGVTPVVQGQVGLRCVHCARSPLASVQYSTIFPGSVGSVGASLRMMSETHFPHCGMTPSEVRGHMDRAGKIERQRSVDEDVEWKRIALLDFCVEFCKNVGIVNKFPAKTGLAFAGPQKELSSEIESDPFATGVSSFQDTQRSGGTMMALTPLTTTSSKRRQQQEQQQQHETETLHMHTATGGDHSRYSGGGSSPQGQRSDYIEEPFPHHSRGPSPLMQGHQQHQSHGGMAHSFASMQGIKQEPLGVSGGATPIPQPPLPPPGSSGQDFPFFQDAYGAWACRYCNTVPYAYRAPGSVWSAANHSPPNPAFIDQHLRVCRGAFNDQQPPLPQASQRPSLYQGQQVYGHSQSSHPHQHHGQSWATMSPRQQQIVPFGQPHQGIGMAPHHHQLTHQQGSPISQYHTNQPPMSSSEGPPPPPYHFHQSSHHPPPPMFVSSLGPPQSDQASGQPPMLQMTSTSAGQHPQGSEPAMHAAIEHLTKAERDYKTLQRRGGIGGDLVLPEDKLLLTEYFYHLMRQLRLCRFSESDRKTRGGKRENVKIGYGGLQCVHCADTPNARKFFWSNVDRLANSFAEIPGHVLKCRRCPHQTKIALAELKLWHPEQMARLPRGSQKVFFRRMWRRLHDDDPKDTSPSPVSSGDEAQKPPASGPVMHTPIASRARAKEEPRKSSPRAASGSSAQSFAVSGSTENAARTLAATPDPSSRVLLGIEEDTNWLSDMDCFIRSQIEVFCATEDDVETAVLDRKYPINRGQVGIRCVHCAMSEAGGARGTAVSYPFSISGIYESVREFQRLHLESCPNLPEDVKKGLTDLKGSSSLSSVLRRYYVLGAKALGMFDTQDGIRAGGDAQPLDASAAFEFTSGGGAPSGISESMRLGAGGPFLDTGPAVTPLESRKRKQNLATPESIRDPDESPSKRRQLKRDGDI